MLIEALNRYIAAKGYIESAKMIYLSPHNQSAHHKSMTVLPMNMLAAFSLELYFKAWLLQSGISSREVKAYSHDLGALYANSKLAGLPQIKSLDDVVTLFANPHQDFSYRYLDDGEVLQTANWLNAFPVFDQLDREVDKFVGASASEGLRPGH